MAKSIFIVWAPVAPRSKLLTEKLGLDQIYLVYALKRKVYLAPIRYILQAIRTIQILIKERPNLVFIQNPPVFAVGIIYLYSILSRTNYIIDAHSAAFIGKRWEWSAGLNKYLTRRALVTLVTNSHLENIIRSWGAKAFILKDVPAEYPSGSSYPVDKSRFAVAVVNSFSPDEPLEEIIEAAGVLTDIQFYVTGDPVRASKDFSSNSPDNLTFTGFLSDIDYYSLLRSADVIMVLTKHDHTQQRGACEALWLGKPIITSNWQLLRDYFSNGAIFVDNSSENIVLGVRQAQESLREYESGIQSLQKERLRDWDMVSAKLKQFLLST